VGEVGTHALSRGGALIVNPRAPSAAFLNPAALAFLKGTQLQLNLNYVNLRTNYVRDCGNGTAGCGPIDVKRDYGAHSYAQDGSGRSAVDETSDPPSYPAQGGYIGQLNTGSDFSDGHAVSNQVAGMPIPTFFASFSGAYFNLPKLTLAASFAAPNSSDAEYGQDEYTRYTLVKKDLLGGTYGISAAYQLTSWLAFGGSFQGQTMGSHQSVTISADPLGIENPDYDVMVDVDIIKHGIPTGNLGLWLTPYRGIELGFSYQHGATAELSGPVNVTLGPELENLSDTLALVEDEGGGKAYATMSQPGIARGGILLNTAKLFQMPLDIDIELDGVYEMWSAVSHVPLRIEGLAMQVGGGEPESFEPIVLPKDWQDAYSIRLGTEWRLLQNTLALRAGGFYESSAIPNETLTVENIDGNKYGAGVGFAYRMGNINLEMGYQGILLDERKIGDESIVHNTNVMVEPLAVHSNGSTRVAMGTYNAQYHIVSVGITGVFGAGGDEDPTTRNSTSLKAASPDVGTGFDDVQAD
tara:strand:+ start:243 stop:1817 length:1575 start_codon:yes stop_codon:yes gene_type:complete